MNLINCQPISSFEPTKNRFGSLVKPTAKVGSVSLIMLLLTRGNPPAWVAGLTLALTMALVTKSKKKKIANPQKMLKKTKDFAGANLREVNLSNANLRNVDLIDANLSGADLSNADLRYANLRIADLGHANLTNADLRDANLSVAYLKGVNLHDADLRGVNLNGANLHNANLRDANLNNADLSGANLNGANLWGASVKNTNLSRANVKNARFKNNLGLSEEVKQDLKQRGAIFENASDEVFGVLTRV
ncbi:pentapeptide repeat-containing protein [Microseira sp. BLCC-F43]|jgi:hypothetical protein|uniref:pentapeptide repeat-containing protein n=1 Tax=Microseira sp. BLCC-F43 TaxID=3153602 RepID=UPI0035BB5695